MKTFLADAVAAANGAPLQLLRVRIGPLSGVSIEALQFAFQALAPDGPAAGARLEVLETRPAFRCPDCGLCYEPPETGGFRCPTCGSGAGELTAGNEVELTNIEVSDV